MKHTYITPAQRERLLTLRHLSDHGASLSQAIDASGLDEQGLRTLLRRYCGSGSWPCQIPDAVFDIPVHDGSAKVSQSPSVNLVRRQGVESITQAELATRIARDQAALHGPRLQHLIDEQRRYNLPRIGRLPEQMAA